MIRAVGKEKQSRGSIKAIAKPQSLNRHLGEEGDNSFNFKAFFKRKISFEEIKLIGKL